MQTPAPSERSAGGAGAAECEPEDIAVVAPLENEGGMEETADNNEEETAAAKLRREIDKAIAKEAEEERSGIAHETVMGMKKSEWLSAMLCWSASS